MGRGRKVENDPYLHCLSAKAFGRRRILLHSVGEELEAPFWDFRPILTFYILHIYLGYAHFLVLSNVIRGMIDRLM